MKLRQQILILLGLPLVCQLASVGYLLISLSRVEEAARKEASDKRVVAVCQELEGLFGGILFEIAAPSFFSGGQDPERAMTLTKSLQDKNRELHLLVRGNPKATSLADNLGRDLKAFLGYLDELVHSYNPSDNQIYLAQFLGTGEFLESMKVLWSRIQDQLQQLMDMYTPTSKDFRPEALRWRENSRNTIIVLSLCNVTVVIALALAVNKHTLDRLQILLANMRSFSRGKQGYQKLSGTDELAELDLAFKEMSDERNRLDEMRKSLQAMLSHDIRSPLSSIDLTLQFILGSLKESLVPDVQRRLGRMHSEIKRLARLVQTLLDVEKMESGTLQTVKAEHTVQELVESSLTAISSLAERKKIEIINRTDGDAILICDPDRTIQVLVNFFSNAIKFAPKGSSIILDCLVRSDGRVRFEIIDEGPGVPADRVDKLFAKFSQLEQPDEIKKQGTGLGLFICKMLIEAQGGQVGYRSPGEKGACFWFELVEQPGPQESV